MPVEAAHKSYWETADVVFGIPLLMGIVAQRIIPLSFLDGMLALLFKFIGAAFLVVGLGLIVLARREFAKFGQPTDPGRPTERIVTTGIFSISRNPLYLGVVGLLAGAALIFNNLWLLIFLAPAVAACNTVLIAPEEKYLAGKFGAEYLSYAAVVHRWLGRARSLP